MTILPAGNYTYTWSNGATTQDLANLLPGSYDLTVSAGGTCVETDVFIVEEHRGKGYSSVLIENMLNEPQLQKVKIWRLATSDAHFLYEKFGFKALKNPEKMMEKIDNL